MLPSLVRLLSALTLGLALTTLGCGARLPAADRAAAVGFVRQGDVWVRTASLRGVNFLEVVIGTDEVDSELPLVVAIHGYGDVPRPPDAMWRHRARPYRMVLPQGPTPSGNGYVWSTTRVSDGNPEALAADLQAAVAALAQFLPVLRAARPTRGSIIVTGFSQGGHVTLALAVIRPDLVGIAMPLAAWIPPSLEPGQANGTLLIRALHPQDDERIPSAPSIALYQRLQRDGWNLTFVVVPGTHRVSPIIESFVAAELDRALLARD